MKNDELYLSLGTNGLKISAEGMVDHFVSCEDIIWIYECYILSQMLIDPFECPIYFIREADRVWLITQEFTLNDIVLDDFLKYHPLVPTEAIEMSRLPRRLCKPDFFGLRLFRFPRPGSYPIDQMPSYKTLPQGELRLGRKF